MAVVSAIIGIIGALAAAGTGIGGAASSKRAQRAQTRVNNAVSSYEQQNQKRNNILASKYRLIKDKQSQHQKSMFDKQYKNIQDDIQYGKKQVAGQLRTGLTDRYHGAQNKRLGQMDERNSRLGLR